MKRLIDTNILLDNPQILNEPDIVLSVKVLKELDGLKRSVNEEIAEKARRAAIYISRKMSELEFSLEDENIPTDNQLLHIAKKYNCQLITNDVCLKLFAKLNDIETHGYNTSDDYTGVSYLNYNTDDPNIINDICTNGEDVVLPNINRQLKEGEYLILKIDDKSVIYKKEDKKIIPVKYRTINNEWIREIKPKNPEQICLFDALNDVNKQIVVIQGRWGGGKSFIANNYALGELERGNIKKIVYVPNNAYVANTIDIGALPGDVLDKSLGQIGPLIDLIGIDNVKHMIETETLEIVPMAYIRGRNFSESIIIVNEAQNLTKDHVKLLLARVGENSKIIFDGDQKQADSRLFKNKNGIELLLKLSNSEKYSKIFSAIKLQKTERSFAASAADYLDELE